MESQPSRRMKNSIAERAAERKKRLVGHRSESFREAEDWDLDYWQSQGYEARLSALVALRNDVQRIRKAREEADGRS